MKFENFNIDISQLPDFEQVKYQSISGKYGVVAGFNIIIFSFILLAGFYVFNFFQPDFFGRFFKYFLYVLIGLLFLNLILTFFAFFTKKYAVRSHDIIYQSGLVKNTTVIIPFNRIQHVDIEEGWLSRMLNLKSLVVYTAGQSGGDIQINGLPDDTSEKIKEMILTKINSETEEEQADETFEAPVDEF